MKKKLMKLFILFVLFLSFYSLSYYLVILEKANHSEEILYFTEQLFSSEIQSNIRQLNFLATDLNFKEAILKNDIDKIELLFDDYSVAYSNFELLLLSDKEGKIIASNTKNSKIKSFNNSELKSLSIKNTAWYAAGSFMPSKVNDINSSDSFYINKISKNNVDSKYIEFVVSIFDISGTRISTITAYYNFNFLSDTLKRFNIEILDANNNKLSDTFLLYKRGLFMQEDKRSFFLFDKEFTLKLSNTVSLFNMESFIISAVVLLVLLFFYFFNINTSATLKDKFIEHELKLLGISFKNLSTSDGRIYKINNKEYFLKNSLINIIAKEFLNKIDELNDLLKSSESKVNVLNIRVQEIEKLNENIKIESLNFINSQERLNSITKIVQKLKLVKRNLLSKKDLNNTDLVLVPIIKNKSEILLEFASVNTEIIKLNELILNQYFNKNIDPEEFVKLIKEKIKKLASSLFFLKNFLNDENLNSIESLFHEYEKTSSENLNLRDEIHTVEIYKSEVLNFKNAIDQISDLLIPKEEPGA